MTDPLNASTSAAGAQAAAARAAGGRTIVGGRDRRAALTPAGVQRRVVLARRRAAMLILNLGALGGLLALVAVALAGGGFSWLDVGILVCVALSAPWTVLGFWNALIGLWLLRVARRPLAQVAPVWRERDRAGPVTARTALLMAIRDEDAERVFLRLSAMRRDLDAGGYGDRYDIHILSDTSKPEIAALEERLFADAETVLAGRGAAFYRRRSDNQGYKAGNIREWVDRAGDGYDFMITLDADSLMGGRLIERMTRCMSRLPRLGILQSLAVGAPAESGFARLFQFGMRHGMRSFTMGSAWWQGDCGPYWGHNAILRVDAFRTHCRLPDLPGRPPFGGPILSHDQVEAAMMRGAGYEVRVVPVEGESWEENPVTLLDFMKREQRWLNGNFQYGPLIGRRGLTAVSRFQLVQAIMMYLAPAAWMVMTLLAAGKALDLDGESALRNAEVAAMSLAPMVGQLGPAPTADDAFRLALGAGLFFTMFLMSLAPKLFGAIDVALEPGGVARYGGAGRFGRGVAGEILFGALMAPAVALHLTLFAGGLLLGRGARWTGQVRDAYGLRWSTAAAKLWPQTLFGAALTAAIAAGAPWLLPWAAPVLLGLLMAIPFAVATASPAFGARLQRGGFAAIPDEARPAPILATALAADRDRIET